MDCQLKRDVNPFVVACFLVTNHREFSFHKTEKPQKHKLPHECVLVTITTVRRPVIKD